MKDKFIRRIMELKLTNETNPILQQIAEPWDFTADGSPITLIKEMTRIMFGNNGLGLAAPQVDVSKRVFIMGNAELLIACINPVIELGYGKIKDIEGCLSFPNLWLHVDRYEKIKVKYYDVEGCLSFPHLWLHVDRYEKVKVKYQDAEGKLIESEYDGIMSRVFQHELDHLNGTTFNTKVSKLSLDMATKRRKKLEKKAK